MPTREALKLAEEYGLDLVEISPEAKPPVCKIMDYGKYCYQESIKEKEARKHQQNKAIKEMKFHCNIGEHDYQTKLNHVREFLQKGHRVKLTLQFRGRENVHKELGFDIINRMIKDCGDLCTVDQEPKMIGRILGAMIAPVSQKQKQTQSHTSNAQKNGPVVAQTSGTQSNGSLPLQDGSNIPTGGEEKKP